MVTLVVGAQLVFRPRHGRFSLSGSIQGGEETELGILPVQHWEFQDCMSGDGCMQWVDGVECACSPGGRIGLCARRRALRTRSEREVQGPVRGEPKTRLRKDGAPDSRLFARGAAALGQVWTSGKWKSYEGSWKAPLERDALSVLGLFPCLFWLFRPAVNMVAAFSQIKTMLRSSQS